MTAALDLNATTPEVLRRTEKRLTNPRTHYEYNEWDACTCGHIYAAVVGRRGDPMDAVYRVLGFAPSASDRLYALVICDVARALGWEGCNALDALHYVSDAAVPKGEDQREKALLVIRKAIDEIEGHERVMMQKVAWGTPTIKPTVETLDVVE